MSASRYLTCLLLIAIGIRLVMAAGLQYVLTNHFERDFLIEGDANGYWELGQQLAKGEPYRIYTPPRYALRMPGYPAVVAVSISLFGDHHLPMRILLAVIGGLCCGLVYLLAREVLPDVMPPNQSELASRVAGGLTCVSPVMLAFTPVLLTETLFAFAVLCSLYGLAILLRPQLCFKRRLMWALLNGVLIGIACYVRPVWLLIAPGTAFLYLLFGERRPTDRHSATSTFWWQRALIGLVLVASTLCVLLPWGLRNQRVTGHFVLTTLWVGPSLYDGLHAGATGESDMTFFETDGLNRSLSEYEVDHEYRRRAWQFAAANPGRAAWLSVVKLWRFWSPWPNANQFRSLFLRVPVAAWFLMFLALAVLAVRTNPFRLWVFVLTAGPILYLTILHIFFIGSLRYRLPAEYPLAILTGSGLVCLYHRWMPRRVTPEGAHCGPASDSSV